MIGTAEKNAKYWWKGKNHLNCDGFNTLSISELIKIKSRI
jgi:hypothetical protein